MGSTSVDLGFFDDDFDQWELESRYFPSKIGGKPAWLDLKNLPSPSETRCSHCTSPLKFLLQLYSPDSMHQFAFHRTLFMFICTNSPCWSKANPPVLVFRCQLARENPYYPKEAPEDHPKWRPDILVGKHCPVCAVCGARGDKRCGRCKGVSYCSEQHQRSDWKSGHKSNCREGAAYNGSSVNWSLKEGIMEREEEPDREGSPDLVEREKYESLVDGKETEDLGVGNEEWDEIESGQDVDKTCDKFRERIRRAPDQILRYDRRGKPLLCAANPPLKPPSNCTCGSKRSFEFQVMPQLLNELHLGLDADVGVDWGSLYVFTCDQSCNHTGYIQEEVQLIDFEATNIPGT